MELNLKLNFLCILVCALLIISSTLSQPIDSTSTGSPDVTLCTYSQACGWIVYEQDKPKMMIKNFCACKPSDLCVKTYHESSNRADVYNCRSSNENAGKDRWPASASSTTPGNYKFRDSD